MAIPSTRTWVPGDLATGPLLNSQIRDVVNFEKTRPRYWTTLNSDLSVANNTWTDVTWNGDLHDSDDIHTGSSALITFVTNGLYDIRCQAMWAANTTGRRAVRIMDNAAGTSIIHHGILSSIAAPDGSAYTGFTQDTSQEVSILRYCAAGFVLKVQVWQNSGGALALMGDLGASNIESYLSIRWVAST